MGVIQNLQFLPLTVLLPQWIYNRIQIFGSFSKFSLKNTCLCLYKHILFNTHTQNLTFSKGRQTATEKLKTFHMNCTFQEKKIQQNLKLFKLKTHKLNLCFIITNCQLFSIAYFIKLFVMFLTTTVLNNCVSRKLFNKIDQ